VFVTGAAYSSDFPTLLPLQASNAGNSDAFAFKIEITPSVITACQDTFNISKNLFMPAQESLTIKTTFTCYPGQYSMKIYNSAGEFIRTLDSQYITGPFASSFPPWDGKNASGEDVASGVYIINLNEPFSRKVAK